MLFIPHRDTKYWTNYAGQAASREKFKKTLFGRTCRVVK